MVCALTLLTQVLPQVNQNFKQNKIPHFFQTCLCPEMEVDLVYIPACELIHIDT